MGGIELGGDARLEYALVHECGNAVAVIDDSDTAEIPFARHRHEDVARVRIACVAQRFDDDVFGRSDVMRGLPALSFLAAEADESVAEVIFNAKRRARTRRFDEIFQGVFAHKTGYLAMPTARLSRMTTTLTCPGYCISFSMRCAMSCARTTVAASSTCSGSTMTRTSRPAWMA